MLPAHPSDNLLLDFLSPEPLSALAARRGLSFTQLLNWLESPAVQAELAALDRLAARRAALLAACLQTTCAATLEHLALSNHSPVESRRAATTALRATARARPPSTSRAPAPPSAPNPREEFTHKAPLRPPPPGSSEPRPPGEPQPPELVHPDSAPPRSARRPAQPHTFPPRARVPVPGKPLGPRSGSSPRQPLFPSEWPDGAALPIAHSSTDDNLSPAARLVRASGRAPPHA